MSVQYLTSVWSDAYFGSGDKVKLLVALAIADNARSEDGCAWPSIETIAAKSRCSVRGAQEAIRAMQLDGKITVKQNTGPHGTNLYCLQFTEIHPRTACTPARPAPRKRASLDCTPTPANERTLPPQTSVSGLHPNRQEPSVEPLVEPSGTVPASFPLVRENDGFEQFWFDYPKKKSKGDAAKAWKQKGCAKILDQILAKLSEAVKSSDWTKDNGRFIPYPASWLRADGWEDVFTLNSTQLNRTKNEKHGW